MATLAESVMSGAQETVNQQGRTVGDAMQAYHIAQTAAHATQELEMEKQNQQMNKANFIMQGIARANGMAGPVQKQYIDQLTGTISKMDPNIDTSGLKALVKSPEELQKVIAANHYLASTGGVQNPEQAAYAVNSLGMEGVTKLISDHEEHLAKIQAAQLGMAQVRQQGVNLQTHTAAVKAITDDSYTKQLLTSKQNLENAIQNYEKGGATPQEFAELQQAVRANLGIKGQTGVGERQESYLKSVGLSIDKVNQFLSGNPQSVLESDPAFSNQILGLARLEVANKSQQGLQQIDKNSKRYKSFYQAPGMAAHQPDFEATLDAQKQQFAPQGQAAAGIPQQQTPVAGTVHNPDGSVTHMGVRYIQQNGSWVAQPGAQAGGQ